MSNFTTATSTSVTSVTAFLALTTPFAEPPACKHGYVVITDTQSAYNNVFLVSDPASPDYTSCQPQEYRPENSHSYSAAVCPESWNAINMATHLVVTSKFSDSTTIPSTRTISSAHCCMSNYDLVSTTTGPLARLGPFCLESYKSYSTATQFSTLSRSDGTVEVSFVRQVNPAMWIAWESADVSTLSPQPPDLTSDMRIPTWTPGMTLPKGFYDNYGRGPTQRTEGQVQAEGIRTTLLAVGIPLALILLIVTSCCYCCCAPSRRKKREAEAAALATERAVIRPQDHTNEVELHPPPKYSPYEGAQPAPSFPLTTLPVHRI